MSTDVKVRSPSDPTHPFSPCPRADLQSWADLLSATIKSSRLSGSKTQKLAEDSKSLPAPSESTAVTSFLRLNNSLGQMDKTRINSIYVFDAVARANKGVKGKEAFLGMMEGVVESFVGGLVEDGRGGVWAEGKVRRGVASLSFNTRLSPRSYRLSSDRNFGECTVSVH
jgi:hypothetical protein